MPQKMAAMLVISGGILPFKAESLEETTFHAPQTITCHFALAPLVIALFLSDSLPYDIAPSLANYAL